MFPDDQPVTEEQPVAKHSHEMKTLSPLAIQGTEGMVVSYGKCCRPIPGDQIVGLLSKGRGLVIHQQGCKNVSSENSQSDRLVDVKWSDNLEGDFPCIVKATVQNERGVLARLATIISDEGANIDNVEVADKDGLSTTISFMVAVHGRGHLARIMRRLRRVKAVLRLWRDQ
jgi:GTP pyrophosphokinase